jgi:biopolymer transport protein ExbD
MNLPPKFTLPIFALLFCLLTCFISSVSAQDQGKSVTIELVPVVKIAQDGRISLNDQPVNINRLVAEVHRVFPNATAVYLSAEKSATWDAISQVMKSLSSGQIPIKLVAN